MALSDMKVRSAKPEAKAYKLTDGDGMVLLVHPNGSKYWRLRYRFGGKEKMLALGKYPEVSLADARARRDEARKLLANGVDPSENKKAVIDTNNSTQVPHASTSSKAQLSPSVNTVLQPRSGNLSLPKTFSDLDKDRASREGFEYVARYFENSLFELKQRNPSIEVEFQPVDSSAFTCAIYLHGTRTGQCGVWRGDRLHGVGSVCFSHDGMVRNSYNESLSLADNGQSLGFRTMMGFTGNSHNTLLTNEGMAEHLWDMFFKSVKQCMS